MTRARPNSIGLSAAVAALAVFTAGAPVPSSTDGTAGARFRGSAGVGFDSFRERYSILDSDTLDSITELRSRLALTYTRGSLFNDFVKAGARATAGDDGFEYSGHLGFTERFGNGAGRVGVDADASTRTYRDDSSYEFANDFSRYYARAHARWNPAAAVSFGLADRVEVVDYDRRTEFDYDYTRNTVAVGGEFVWDVTSVVAASIDATSLAIPDSTEIAYRAWSPVIELRINPAPHRRLSIYADLERRLFAHEPARSPFWSLFSTVVAEMPLGGGTSVEARGHVESYQYDSPGEVYFDFTETRGALLARYNPSWDLSFGLGPTAAIYTSGESPEDEYDELGARAVAEVMRGRRAWVTASYEVGRRSYDAYDSLLSDIESIYSNYGYHRVYLLAVLQIWDGLTLSTLFDYQPEDHEREGDDATATLFSSSLTYSF